MEPRRAHVNERFALEIWFESALPEGALPYAELAGPIGPGGPALTFWTVRAGSVEGDRSRMKLTGVPRLRPTGVS